MISESIDSFIQITNDSSMFYRIRTPSFGIFLRLKMGNELNTAVQSSLSFVLDTCNDIRKIFSGITAHLSRRTQREERSPLINATRCRLNCEMELLENHGLMKRRKGQIAKNGQLFEGNGQAAEQNGECEEVCFLNKPLHDEEIDVPPPLPPKKNRIRRYGVSYNDCERESLLKELTGQKECYSRCVSITDESSTRDSSEPQEYKDNQTITDCKKYTVKRFSLPNLHSGCLLAGTNKESDRIDIIDSKPQTLNITTKNFETMSNADLGSGGIVVFGELTKHISISNIYAENPIVFKDLPENFEIPSISSTKELKIKQERKLSRSHSGGGLIVDTSSKVSLPYLCSLQPKISPPRFHRSMSGGWISRSVNADHVIVSDLLSKTFRCGEFSEIENSQNPKGYSWNETITSYIPHGNDLPENISGKKFEIENCQKTEDHSKNEPNVTSKEKNQIPATEISRMIEEALKLSERKMM